MSATFTVAEVRVILSAHDEMSAVFKNVLGVARTAEADIGGSMRKLGQHVSDAGMALTKFTAPVAAAAGLSLKAAIDFESGFAGVRKTVDATGPELQQLALGFRKLATEMPISAVELTKVGEAAGQLGVKKEHILSFTETMAKLGATTNLTADEAATAMAQFSNVMGTSQGDVAKLGNALVALGNDGASTEKQIIDMAQRIAGAGKEIGLTEGEVLGLANALSSVGIEAEMGGTAISKVMINIAAAVDEGGNAVEEFAKVARMSNVEFSKLFKADSGAAMAKFIEGLAKTKMEGGSLLGVVRDLDINETRLRDTMLRVGNAGEMVTKSMALGNKAFADGNQLNDEYAKRLAATASQLSVLWNKVTNVAITFGDALLPTLRLCVAAVDGLLPLLDGMAKTFAALPGPVQLAVVSLGAIVIAAGPVVFIVGQLIVSLGQLKLAYTAVTTSTMLASWFGTLTGLAGGFSTALGVVGAALMSPVAIMVLVVAALTALAYGIMKATGTWDTFVQVVKDVAAIVGFVLKGAFNDAVATLQKFAGWLGNLAREITGPVIGAFKQMMAWLKDHIPGWVITLITKIGGLATATKDVVKNAVGSLHQFADAARDTATSAEAAIRKIGNAAGGFQNQVVKPIMSGADALKLLTEQVKSTNASMSAGTGGAAFAVQLAKARAEIAALTPALRKDLAEAIRSGAFDMDALKKMTNLSEEALNLFSAEVKKTEKTVEDAAEKQKKFQESVRSYGTTVLTVIPKIQTFRDVINGVYQLNYDFSYGLMLSQIAVDSLGNAIKVNLVPSLGRLGKQAIDTGNEIRDNLKASLASIPDVLKDAFTGGGDLMGAIKAIGVDLANGIIQPMLEGLSMVQKTAVSTGAAIAAGLGQAAGLGKTTNTIIGMGTALAGTALMAAATSSAMAGAASAGVAYTGVAMGTTLSVGAMTLGIGAAAVGVAVLIKKWWDHKKEVAENTKLIGEFQQHIWATLTPAQAQEAAGRTWAATVIGVRDAYLATGRSAADAERDVKALWDSTTQGAAASKAAIDTINQAFIDQKQAIEDAKRVTEHLQTAASSLTDFLKIGAGAYAELAGLQKDLGDLEAQYASARGTEKQKLAADIAKVTAEILIQKGVIEASAVTTQAAATGMAAALVVSFVELQKRGMSATAALKAVEPGVIALETQIKAAGLNGGAAFTELRAMVDLAKDAIAGPALDAVAALGRTLDSMHSSGLMNKEMFVGLTSQIGQTWDTLIKQGKDGDRVMRSMQPSLQKLWEIQQKTGMEVDATTQRLIDQAVEAKIIGEQHQSDAARTAAAMERVVTVLEAWATKMGVALPAAAKKGVDTMVREFDKARDAAKDLSDEVDGVLYGHSPGGLKDYAPMASRAGSALTTMFRNVSSVVKAAGKDVDNIAKAIGKIQPPDWLKKASGAAKDAYQDLSRDLAILKAPTDFSKDTLRLQFQKEDELQGLREQAKALGPALGPLMAMVNEKYRLMLDERNREERERQADAVSRGDGFATGTPNLGFVNFGSGRNVRLHGEEAVVPKNKAAQFGASMTQAIESALHRIDGHLQDQPREWGVQLKFALAQAQSNR